jgi:hypothetical protein
MLRNCPQAHVASVPHTALQDRQALSPAMMACVHQCASDDLEKTGWRRNMDALRQGFRIVLQSLPAKGVYQWAVG